MVLEDLFLLLHCFTHPPIFLPIHNGFYPPFGTGLCIKLWIKAFLTDRSQRASSEVHVTPGVPQGSVLGPCLLGIPFLH